MAKKNDVKNYRTKFKRYYNIDFSSDYAIHHIDLNHDNNDINNLMILPRSLHQQYHYYVNGTEKTGQKYVRGINVIIRNHCHTYDLIAMEQLINVMYECSIWADYKKYLDGEMPNVHNIKFKKYMER